MNKIIEKGSMMDRYRKEVSMGNPVKSLQRKRGTINRLFAGLVMIFLTTGLFASSGPCPVSPGPLTIADNGMIYLAASHPWYGVDAGAIASINSANDETIGYRYPMLITANTTIDPFRPVSICFSKQTGRIYAAYRREGTDDGLLVMDPPGTGSAKATSPGKKEAGWGRIAAIGLSLNGSGLLVLHTVVENLTVTAERTGTRVEADLHFRLTALPLDEHGFPVRSLASVQWSRDETVDELRPGAVSLSGAVDWLTSHRLIRVGCVQPDGTAWLIIGDKLSKVNPTDNTLTALSTSELNRVVALSDSGEHTVSMLRDMGSTAQVVRLNSEGTVQQTLSFPVPHAAGLAFGNGSLVISSSTGNFLYSHGAEKDQRIFLCSTPWVNPGEDLSIRILTPADGARTQADRLTVTGQVTESSAAVTVSSVPATMDGVYFTADVPLTEGENTITATATKDTRSATCAVHVIREPELSVTITEPADGLETTADSVSVSGTVSVDGAQVTVNGQQARVDGKNFSLDSVALALGGNIITAHATTAIQSAQQSARVIRTGNEPLRIAISSPETGIGVGNAALTVVGTINLPGAAVTVNGTVATVTGTDFTAAITLTDGENLVHADGKLGSQAARDSIIVVLDRIPPEIRFTGVQSGAVLTSTETVLEGTVTDNTDPNPTLAINGTAVPVTTNTFHYQLNSLTDGSNAIQCVAKDRFGNTTDVPIDLTVDSKAPSVSIDAPDWIFRTDSISVPVHAADNAGVTALRVLVNGSPVYDGSDSSTDIPLQVAPDAQYDTVNIRAEVRDAAGNRGEAKAEIPVYERRYCYLNVFDDNTGHLLQQPLQSKNIRNQFHRKGASLKSEGNGRVGIITDSIGGALLSLRAAGFTEVRRVVGIFQSHDRLFDARLTPLNPNPAQIGADGGTIDLQNGVTIEIPAGALTEAHTVRVTEISPQGLISFLPMGWSPVKTLDVALDDGYASVFSTSATVTVSGTRFLESGDKLLVAEFDSDSNRWTSIGTPSLQDGSLSFSIPGAGRFTVVVADRVDAPTLPQPGEVLTGKQNAGPLPTANARSWTDPAKTAVQPHIRAVGTIEIPDEVPVSGLKIRAEFKQKINRIGTGEEESAPVSEDLILYSWPGREDMAPVISARFPVIPTGEISSETVSSGEITVTFLNREETGNARVVSPDYRWTFETTKGIRVEIPVGGVTGQGVVEVSDASVAIPNGSGLTADTPFALTVEQTSLTIAPSISTRWMPEARGGTTMLCEVLDTVTGPVLKFVCPAEALTDPESGITRLTAKPDAEHPGILTTGTYVFVQFAEAIAEITGETTLAGAPVSGAEVRCATTHFGDISGQDGSFHLTVPADREVQAVATYRSANASATLSATVPAGETLHHDLELSRGNLTLLQTFPEPGRLPSLTPEFELSFATPLESSQDLSTIVTLDNLEITATVDGTQLKIHPDAALPADTPLNLIVKGGESGLKDIYGSTLNSDISLSYRSPMAAGSVSFDFADIHLEQLQAQPGQPSRLRLSAEAGSLPVGTMVEMEDDITMAWFSDTVGSDGSLDHSFAGFPGDQIQLTVTLPDGSRQFRTLTRCRLPESGGGLSTFYLDTEGGTITGTGGIQLNIPKGALTRAIHLTLGMQDAAAHAALEQKFPVAADSVLQSLASFQLDSDRSVDLQLPLTVRVPVEDDGSGNCYQLVDFRESVTLPVVDPATGLPVVDANGQPMITDRNLRVIRGDARPVSAEDGVAGTGTVVARIGCATAGGSFAGLPEFSGCLHYTGGIDRLDQRSEISGRLIDADTGDPVTGFVMVNPDGSGAPMAAPAVDGSFRFNYPDTGSHTKSPKDRGLYIFAQSLLSGSSITGALTYISMCQYGIGTLMGTSTSSGINHLLYDVYLYNYGNVNVEIQDTTPPTFDLFCQVLDKDGLPDDDGQKEFEGMGIVPMDDTLRVRIQNLQDDRDSAPLVIVKSNGTSIPVSRVGTDWIADIGNTPGSSGNVSISVAATDISGNTKTRYKEAWFGVTGGQSLAGPPKVLPLAGYPRDGASEIPAILESDILVSEPVSTSVTADNFLLKEIQGTTLVDPDPAILTYPEARGEVDGYSSIFHLQFSRPLKYDTRYALVISGLTDEDDEKLDQDAVPGLVNGRDGIPETPAEIKFSTVAPTGRGLESPASCIEDIQFLDKLAFCVTEQSADIFTPGQVEIYDLAHPGSIQAPIYAFEIVAVPRAIAVRRFSRTVTDLDGNTQVQNGYLLAVMRRNTRDTNSTITLYEVLRNGNHFTHNRVGLTTHCLSYSQGRGASPSCSLEFRGDLLIAGIANGGIYSDPVSGQETTPDSGIKLYSVDTMRTVYDQLYPLDYPRTGFGPGAPIGLKDFVKTPGFCWDLDVTDALETGTPWAVVGDGSRFSEVLGVDLHEIRSLPEDPSSVLPVDDRVKIRQVLTGKAPYMVEVKEGFSYTDRSGATPERKTISLAVLRANDIGDGPNTVYLLDVTHPESGAFKVLSAIPFGNSERIGYVFADPVQNIIGATLPGSVTRFYDITDPVHPEKLFETGVDGNTPPFLVRGMYDGIAFGSDNQGIAVLNFNPDPFDYAGFKGVLLSQYRETIQKTSIRPNFGVTVFTKDIEGAPVPIDTKIYPRYRLHDRADVTIHAVEINEKGEPVGEEQTLAGTRSVSSGQGVREQIKLSALFGGEEDFQKAFGGNIAPRSRYFRYTIEAKIPHGATYRRVGAITLSPHIVARAIGDTLDHNVHTLTGNLILDRSDLVLPVPELPLRIRRSYTSAGESGIGPAGAGWSFNIFPSLTRVDTNRYVLSGGDFSSMTFIRNGDTFTPEEGQGIHGVLTKDGDGLFTYKTKAGIKYKFKKIEKLYVGTGTPTETEEIPYFIDPYNGSVTNTAPNLSSIEAYGGNKEKYSYDPDTGRLTSITDITGRTVNIRYTYAGGAWRITSLNPAGSSYFVRYTYDRATGDLLSATISGAPAGGIGQPVTEQYSYYGISDNLPHNLKSITDPAGHSTGYTYTKKESDITLPDGRKQLKAEPVSTIGYPDGSTLSVTVNDEGPAVTSIITLIGTGGSATHAYHFNDRHILTSQNGPLGTTTYSDYDENARDFRIIRYPDGTVETRDFDTKGNRILLTLHASPITHHPSSITETWTYDPTTNKITSHSAPAGTTTFTYAGGWKLSEQKFNGITVQTATGWNAYGQPTGITNQYGETTTYQYDRYSNLICTQTQPQTQTYSYTLLGQLKAEHDNRGKDITYRRDALGRIHEKTETEGGVGTRTTTYTLDGNGNILEENCSQTGYNATRTYDGMNRLSSETITPGNGSTDTVSHTNIQYDIFGNIISETLPNGATHTQTVDAAGRVTGETLGSTATRTVTYEAGSTRIQSDSNKVSGITKSYSYDIFDHITSLSLSSGSDTYTRTFTFNAHGLLATKVDVNGIQTTYEYDTLNRVTTETVASASASASETITTTYDDASHSTTVTNQRTGLVTKTKYNILNEPVHIEQTVDGQSRTTDISYDGTGASLLRITSNSNGTGLTEEISATGKPLRTETAGHIITTYSYTNGGLTATVHEDAYGDADIPRTRTIKKDALNRTIETTDGNGNITTIRYDTANRTVTTNQPENRTIVETKDIFGRPVTKTINGTTVEHHSYTPGSTRDKITNRYGGTVTTETDPAGRPILKETNDGTTTSTTTTTYNGLTTTVTQPGSRVTITSQDALGRPLTITHPDSTEDTFTYEGNITTHKDPNGVVTVTETNEAGEQKKTTVSGTVIQERDIDYNNRAITQTTYADKAITTTTTTDINGFAISKKTGDILTTWTRDHSGRSLTAKTGNRIVTSTYDGNGNLISMNDGSGRTTAFTYDALNRKTATIQPDGLTTTYSYNPLDDLTGVETLNGINTATYTWTDPKTISKTFAGNTTTFKLDGLGRTVGITRSNGTVRTDTYDNRNTLVRRSDFDGANWTHHYDPMNRPSSLSVSSGTQTQTVVFRYDSDGNLTDAVTDGQTGTMTYDTQGRLTSRTFENGKTVSYTYYPGGQIHTITDNLGSTIGYQYNSGGLLDKVVDGSNNTLAAYTYTDEGYVDTITQPGADTKFTHDPAGRIITQTAKDNDGSVLVADTFTYDNAGNITHKTETRGDQTWNIDYDYTTDHRLSGYTIKQGHTTLQTVAFKYDEAGNRIHETYEGTENKTVENTFNEMNQLVSSRITNHESQVTVVDYTYDQGGRLTSSQVTDHESQVTSVEYGYNSFGNLISVASTTPQATSEAAYTYSYDGKRISKYIDGTLYDYTYTGNNLLETYADTAGRIAKYTYGNALISQSDATGTSESVVTDYQNSVSASVSASGGALTLFAYDPFGKVRYQSNPDAPQGLGWLSRQYDSETGNNYLINRYYNADRGGFLSPDRYQYVQTTIPFTLNLYQYAYANPLVNVDPEGNAVPITLWARKRQEVDRIHMEELEKKRHDQLVAEFTGTGVENPEQFIENAKGLDYEGNAIFSTVNDTTVVIRKGRDRTHLEVLQWKNYYTVKEGKLTLTQRNVPSRKRHWLDYKLATDNWVETTTEKAGAHAIRTEDRMLFRLSDAIIGEKHIPDFLYFGGGASVFAALLGGSSSTTVNIIREKGHFFPTQLLITGDSTGFTPEEDKLQQLKGLNAPWYVSGGLGVMISSGVFAGFGKRKKPDVNLMEKLLGASKQTEGGPLGSKILIGIQHASDPSANHYNKVGVTFGTGAGAARSTPTSLEFYKTNLWYRRFLNGGQQ